MRLAPGNVLANRYEIDALVGRGAMGAVFRARDAVLGETVALKVIELDARDAVRATSRFRQEVKLARRVTHKNVARVFDLVEGEDALVLTMELVEGETLADVLARATSLPIDRAVRVALEICAGLEAVHAAGVVHRDLKPGNVILEGARDDGIEPRVVLTDFGVAKSSFDATSLSLGAVVGTPKYMSPEQAEGLVTDARTDVFALGVVMRDMVREGTDARWDELARRCTERERDARPSSVREIAEALAPLATRADRSVLVPPFRVAGDAALGEVIADELEAVLATIPNLRVIAARHGERPRVDAIVDGDVRIDGDRVRITARLVESPSGRQLWRDTFDGSLSELFSFERTIAKRVAEHLRLHVAVMMEGEGVPTEAVRAYLDACALKEAPSTSERALELLARAIAIHPRFAPALSAFALRSLVAWYVPFVPTPPDFGETCARRVEHALRDAGSLAETHVAAAVLELERGAPREAEVALRRALRLAPTCVEALTVLGELECMIGRSKTGVARARLALDLDPHAVIAATALAREEAFAGRFEACVAILDALGEQAWTPPPYLLRVRAAAWLGEPDMIRAWLSRGASMSDASGQFPYGEMVGRALLGETPFDALEPMVTGLLALGKSPRFAVESHRIAVEIAMIQSRPDDALRHVDALGDAIAFIDAEWIDRCPALRRLAGDPRLTRAREKTRRRAHASA